MFDVNQKYWLNPYCSMRSVLAYFPCTTNAYYTGPMASNVPYEGKGDYGKVS